MTIHALIHSLRDRADAHSLALDPELAAEFRQAADLLNDLRDAPNRVAKWLRAQAEACSAARAQALLDAAACLESGASFKFYQGQK